MRAVIFVDDEPHIREGLHTFADWRKLGYSVEGEAGDGPSAVDLIKQISPSLVICDIGLPALNGLDVFEQVKTWAETEARTEPPMFLMLTDNNDFECARRAMRLGAVGYLTKPFGPDELVNEIGRIFGGDKYAPPESFFSLPYDRVTEAVKDGTARDVTEAVELFFSTLRSGDMNFSYSEIALCRLADLLTRTAAECGVQDENRAVRLLTVSDMGDIQGLALSICLSLMEKRRFNEHEVLSYISGHCAETLTLRRISELFSVPARQISAAIKKLTGRKFNDYLNYCRVEAAKRLLAGSKDVKISDVCESAGYSDYVYFNMKFKELTGMSPSAFKRLYA